MSQQYPHGAVVRSPGTVIITAAGWCHNLKSIVTPDLKPDTYLSKLRNASKRELLIAVMELARHHVDLELREPMPVSRPQAAYDQIRESRSLQARTARRSLPGRPE